jgi:hypothetical protein
MVIIILENLHRLAYTLLYGKLQNYSRVCFYAFYIQIHNHREKGGEEMKKLAIQIVVIGTMVATYALPILAAGGAGY